MTCRAFLKRTLKADAVALQALHGLLEELLATRSDTGNVVLLPLNRSVDVLEYLLHRVGNLGTNTVTGDKGNLRLFSAGRWKDSQHAYGVHATILGRQLGAETLLAKGNMNRARTSTRWVTLGKPAERVVAVLWS
jgi:hypothetical protein